MPLIIRDPRAAQLVRELAKRRGTTMTLAIITALEAEIERDRSGKPITARLSSIPDDTASQSLSRSADVA